ncbi:hypothetical protein, partial [Curtobacterium sp. MCBA15_003]|uniref:hypothetical protein n=1 Tax=Curtobacterium sp. MCBA15_003 TaxID=1898732 RepID=UPI001C3126F2
MMREDFRPDLARAEVIRRSRGCIDPLSLTGLLLLCVGPVIGCLMLVAVVILGWPVELMPFMIRTASVLAVAIAAAMSAQRQFLGLHGGGGGGG